MSTQFINGYVIPTLSIPMLKEKKDGTMGSKTLAYAIETTIGGSNLISLSLREFNNGKKDPVNYLTIAIDRKGNVIISTSEIPNKQGLLTESEDLPANLTAIVVNHFLEKYDTITDDTLTNDHYKLMTVLFPLFTQDMGEIDFSKTITRKIANLSEVDIFTEWLTITSSDPMIQAIQAKIKTTTAKQ